MVTDSRTNELKQAIRDFEFRVDVPVSIDDSDSIDKWKCKATEAFDRMTELVERQRKEIHAKVFAEIASQDASKRAKIEKLAHADKRIDDFIDVVKAHLAAFALGVDVSGPEPDGENQLFELRDASHRLAASVLAQEEEIASWFAESFDR